MPAEKNPVVAIVQQPARLQALVDAPPLITAHIASAQGPSGPPGPAGAQGPAGEGDLNFVHQQGVPSDVWVCPHGLGKFPSVTVIDSAGDRVAGAEVHYDSVNQCTLRFGAPFSGSALFN